MWVSRLSLKIRILVRSFTVNMTFLTPTASNIHWDLHLVHPLTLLKGKGRDSLLRPLSDVSAPVVDKNVISKKCVDKSEALGDRKPPTSQLIMQLLQVALSRSDKNYVKITGPV